MINTEKNSFLYDWSRLIRSIDKENSKAPYLGLREASITFREPYLRCIDSEVIALAVMLLLLKCAYHTGASYGKFPIGYVMSIPIDETSQVKKVTYKENISFTIGKSIPLTEKCDNMVPNMDVYAQIWKYVKLKGEEYANFVLTGIFIRVYLKADQDSSEIVLPLSYDQIASQILQLMETGRGSDEPREVQAIRRGKKH